MTNDTRNRRTATLIAAAKAKSETKTRDAEQAIRALVKRGDPVTFQSVQREAGVSHAFLYNHPELRARIEHLRAQSRPARYTPAPPPDTESSLVLALSSQITQLKKLHRQQVNDLRDALAQAHGENLDLRRELTRRGGTWPGHFYPTPSTQ
ncbi:DUF6262 family protein [Nocardia suismassiliense]|uniref:DUF6262 family protein n=1 Tax=Nocardia suismassiliense TaxID=2077092 RepID=A0ABW6R803_9NOCA